MTDQTKGCVSLDARYLSAWGEINVRIAQRQNAISIYTTIVAAAMGLVLVNPPLNGSSYVWRVAYLVPLASAVFFLLLWMHERMIHNLHRFLIECERLDAALPSYHDPDSDWYKSAKAARTIQDWIAIILIVVPNTIAAAVAFPPVYRSLQAPEQGIQWAVGVLVVLLGVLTYRIRYLRHPAK